VFVVLKRPAAMQPARYALRAAPTAPRCAATPARVPRPARGAAPPGAVAAPERVAAAPPPPAAAAAAAAAAADSDSEADEAYFGPGASATRAAAAAAPTGRVLLESAAELRSTAEHRAWVALTTGLLGAAAAAGLARVDSPAEAAGVAAAALGAYVFSDLGTGVYHWAVDNYGSGATPLVGGQIAAFQGHHVRPWTITEREFANNVHQVFRPAAAPAAAIAAAAAAGAPPAAAVGAAAFLFLACMSQQFHAWSHMKRSQLPAVVAAAQDAGVLISRRAHGAHHRAPFEGNYCIVSGLWNGVLDQGGADDAPFRRLERAIFERTGIAPRCWAAPEDGWEELERPAA
jgi:hypothetical protein